MGLGREHKLDPTCLKMIGTPAEGDFLDQVSLNTLPVSEPPDNTVGTISGGISDTLMVNSGANGTGVLETLQFQVLSQNPSSIQLTGITL